MPSADIIDQFLHKYRTEDHQEYYARLAEYVGKICKDLIDRHGKKKVQANVTYRVKGEGRLQEKLEKRQEHRRYQYKSEHEIREDIVDIVGVRIALFSPSDRKPVCEIIGKEFHIDRLIEYPKPDQGQTHVNQRTGNTKHGRDLKTDQDDDIEYDRSVGGYQATHLWARFYHDRLPIMFRSADRVEIQVMTVLQSAWSEVEYDIIYKCLHGKPSQLDCQMVDGISGLVSIGEMYLNQINTVRIDQISSSDAMRKRFEDDFELTAFLLSRFAESRRRERFTLTSVELLRKFLGLPDVKADNKHQLGIELSDLRLEAEQAPQYDILRDRKENITLIVMRYIYSKRHLSERAQKLQPSASLKRCGILISTVISLHDLFPPTSNWANELTGCGREEHELTAANRTTRNDLQWLLSKQTPRNIALGELSTLRPSECEKIDELWKWFSEHNSEAVQFVFSISKLGVARNLRDDLQSLEEIYYSLEGFLIEP